LSQSTDGRPNLAFQYFTTFQLNRRNKAVQFAWDIGLISFLVPGPRTIDEITDSLAISSGTVELVLDNLKYAGWVEQYGDDYAVSSMTRLIYQAESSEPLPIENYWSRFQKVNVDTAGDLSAAPAKTTNFIESQPTSAQAERYRFRESLRQWTWSAAAKQASAVLYDDGFNSPNKLIELGGGASIFAAAFAYQNTSLSIVSVDTPALIEVAQKTIRSIEVEARWNPLNDDYRHIDLPLNEYDDCLLVNSLKLEADPSAVVLLGRCFDTLKPGGRLIIIEQFEEPDFDEAELAIEKLTMRLEGCPGTLRSTAKIQRLLTGAGFGAAKWGPLESGPTKIGLMVVEKSV
jgi:ubiquinone/menaquinone biosynthesis C-methylase UbiE